MKLSHYQEKIINDVATTKENMIIEAGPGCSKTIVLVESSKKIRGGRTILCSFSKLIADELAERVCFGVESSTLNALGNRVVRAAMPKIRFNKFKDWNILRGIVGEEEVPRLNYSVERVIGLLKNNLVLDNVMEAISEIIKFHAIETPEKYDGGRFEEIVETVYNQSIRNDREMSYDDQKLLVVKNDLNVNMYDTMLVDESQDLSPLDIELVSRCARRKVFVGDRFQSIFAFRGALSGAMDQIKERFNCVEYELPICYRCPTSIIEEARMINPRLEDSGLRGDGEVRTVQKQEFRDTIADKNDIILCRTTAPLIRECLKMLGMKSCYVKGRRIGESLERVIKEVAGEGGEGMDIVDFDIRLNEYFIEQSDRLSRLGRMETLSELEDKVESIKVFEERARDVEELIRIIGDVVVDDSDGIAFMTMHKSKGLEAQKVWVLRRDLLPHKKARTEEQLEQERNLEYVAITRSQYGLYTVIKERNE